MPTLRLGVSLQPRWPQGDGTAALRAARHAEDLGFDHVAVGNRLLDSGFGLDADPLVLLSAVSAATKLNDKQAADVRRLYAAQGWSGQPSRSLAALS